MRETIVAQCYACNCGYPEGTMDCEVLICPLHDFMPYRKGGPRKSRRTDTDHEAKLKEKNLDEKQVVV